MHETWTADGLYLGCKQLNSPATLRVSKSCCAVFPSNLHAEGATGIATLDLSESLGCAGPATSPNLCASFIRIRRGEQIGTDPNATSQLFYAVRGNGSTNWDGRMIDWRQGDIFTLPVGPSTHFAQADSAFYWVHDGPLLTYLGVRAAAPQFQPTVYQLEDQHRELVAIRANCCDRVSVSLANRRFEQSATATHVLRATYGVLPAGACQLPHRHQSAAIDFVISCRSQCWTLLGKELNANGDIHDPVRIDWKTGSVFVTPAGWWHSHFNESADDAYILPVQDAGLHIHMKTLDIQVFNPYENSAVFVE